jgi:glycosyltransferase involved in cell wall biosynthesis
MISILIPIYNGIEFIEESVSSILNQTYDQWELIIGINGHMENSDVYRIAKEYEKKCYGKIHVYDFYKIKGKSNTLNEMIKYCNYDYVALLDVDDIWHPQKLQLQTRFLNHYDVIGSKCVWFGDRPGVIPNIPLGDISNFDFSTVNPIINSSCIIKKELCYWNENGVEDYDLWLRLRSSNKKFFNCKEILVKHRIHNASAFNAKGNDDKVDDLLVSHGFKSRAEKQNDQSRIHIPQINKMNMNLFNMHNR